MAVSAQVAIATGKFCARIEALNAKLSERQGKGGELHPVWTGHRL